MVEIVLIYDLFKIYLNIKWCLNVISYYKIIIYKNYSKTDRYSFFMYNLYNLNCQLNLYLFNLVY